VAALVPYCAHSARTAATRFARRMGSAAASEPKITRAQAVAAAISGSPVSTPNNQFDTNRAKHVPWKASFPLGRRHGPPLPGRRCACAGAITIGCGQQPLNPGFPICLFRTGEYYIRASQLSAGLGSLPLQRLEPQSRDPSRPTIDRNRLGSTAFLGHLSTLMTCLRLTFFVHPDRQPVGTGRAQIRRSIAPNSRRVR
jgi:hypothetical protein